MDEEKLSIRAGAQRKRINGTREYEQHVSVANRRGFQKPSRIAISIDEAEELVREHAGTGKMKTTRDGKVERHRDMRSEQSCRIYRAQGRNRGSDTPVQNSLQQRRNAYRSIREGGQAVEWQELSRIEENAMGSRC